MFDPFDALFHRVMEVNPHAPLVASPPAEEVTLAEEEEGTGLGSLVRRQGTGGWLGPRFPLMPFSGLMGGLFESAGLLESLLGDLRSFEVPNVTLSDAECLITVDLKDLDVNHTSFKVYGSAASGISVEISTVKEARFDSSSSPNTTATGSVEESHKLLRGAAAAASVSSMTTVRSFPTPQGCGIDSESSKATINEHTNQLLIKLPKLDQVPPTSSPPGEEETAATLVHPSQPLNQVPRAAAEEENAADSERPSWLSKLFGRKSTGSPAASPDPQSSSVQEVPMVKYDEF
eukprot:Protomagalhaensia_wolfi_Nauph_80__795@NODE_145_length_3444_cov_52_757709_g108_i0_p1_GENE_NODE_145_length_3444_cov_52_757709_g108_i0NODE_145_length_3444_cov_52_757709_g108_i0_p1_ORF_typecomplete_len337_score65_97Flexi_CP/PF00286_20/3_3e03Flexi_CP/PF00286_20/0_35_NODE_145_length_3444_cov_52_757709_g108_i01431012